MQNDGFGEKDFKDMLAGYLRANFMSGPFTEWQIEVIKETFSCYCEAKTILRFHIKKKKN